jgi:hypothetical protein
MPQTYPVPYTPAAEVPPSEAVGGAGGLGGSGTANTLSKFTAADELGDSRITDNGVDDLTIAASTNLLFTSGTSLVKFGAGLAEDAFGYNNGTGPVFYDNETALELVFNVQQLTAARSFTWPDRSGRVATTFGTLTDARFTRFDSTGNVIRSEVLQEDGNNVIPVTDGITDLGIGALAFRQLYLDSTITPVATTGAQTINKAAGSVNFAATDTSLVVTCDKCSESSIVIAIVATNDTTLKSVQAVPGTGSFTLFGNAAATAETRVNFWVLNQ